MIPIKLNNQPYNFPTEAHEVSLGQFFALRKSKNILDEICSITGIDRQTVQNFKGRTDLECCHSLLNSLGAKLQQGLKNPELPKQTTFADKTVKVPKNLKIEPVGAFIAVHNLIREAQVACAESNVEFDPAELIPQVLAHYFWLPFMGDGVLYSDEKIDDEAYMEQLLTMPVTDAIPIANFFFWKYPNL